VLFATLGSLLGLLLAFGAWEYRAHRRNLASVPIRIHVNGTRGKSSVTRLIAAGLRAGGIVTCAKTTGSAPRMILEDGAEYPIQRQGRANIIEQARTLSVAAQRNAQALVLECMALNPRYQSFCEEVLVRSTVGVITNVRADHLDVMGPTVTDVAKALCGTVPRGGLLVTAESDPGHLALMEDVARRQGSTLVRATPEGQRIREDDLAGFSYIEHPDNVALALEVCARLGIPREKAIAGMWAARPDIGVLRVVHLDFFGKKVDFINGFAANDPDSTLAIWNLLWGRDSSTPTRVVMLNCRADRVHRSVQLGEILPRMKGLDVAIVTGTGTRPAVEAALEAGLAVERLIALEAARADDIFERALAQIPERGLVYGIGNIGGVGHAVVEYFENRAIDPARIQHT